jgi:glycosyltransferase involved in cell wall biosynthesis
MAIDDGSTDRSPAILRQYAQRDARLKVLTRTHEGIVASLNAGLAAANSKYIARMDADDISESSRLERQVAYLDEHPECVAVGCSVLVIDSDGEPLWVASSPVSHEDIEKELLIGNGGALRHPSAIFPRSALDTVGSYREFLRLAEDLDLYLRLGEIGRLANLDEALLHYRVHRFSANLTRTHEMQEAVIRAIASAYERRDWSGFKADSIRDCIRKTWLSSADLEAQWGYQALHSGHSKTARKHFVEAIRQRPVCLRFWRALAAAQVRTWLGPRSVNTAQRTERKSAEEASNSR